jgi:hypothetical protein
MFRKCVAIAFGCVLSVVVFSTSASAATLAGSNCQANEASIGTTLVSLRGPVAGGMPDVIPAAGVITSWSLNLIPLGSSETEFAEQLKVFRPTGTPDQFEVVGESVRQVVAGGKVTTAQTRVPVQAGDLLGNSVLASQGPASATGSLFCITGDGGDEAAFFEGDPTVGTVVTPSKTKAGTQNPMTVTVEPDADGDGYGDQTQDQCPTDASAQGPCPVPGSGGSSGPGSSGSNASAAPAPIALSGSATPRGGTVVVTVTASAQANVTVAGAVALGKGKVAKVGGGTQLIAPGTLAKFTIVLPAKVKAALAHLPRGHKVSLKLTASAPGATAANLTAKLAGQAKPHSHRHGKGTH